MFDWQEIHDHQQWDDLLALMGGHPLQSSTWGSARKVANGINDLYWCAFKNKKPVFLARVEERRILKFIKVAWVPKGPVVLDKENEKILFKQFLQLLKKQHFYFCVTNPWKKSESKKINHLPEATIWVDLSVGKEKLWSSLSKKFRYEVRQAKNKGVVVEEQKNEYDIQCFYQICKQTSQVKDFYWNASLIQLQHLLFQDQIDKKIEFRLFVARYKDECCGGAMIARTSESVHYIWGGMDRKFSKLCLGEALQWAVIEWALQHDIKLYDLEGIDPQRSSGTYQFKKKLGGEIVMLPGLQFFLLTFSFGFLVNIFNKFSFFLHRLNFKRS